MAEARLPATTRPSTRAPSGPIDWQTNVGIGLAFSNPSDFFKSRDARRNLRQPILEHCDHSVGLGGTTDLVRARTPDRQAPHGVAHHHHLENADAPAEAGAVARFAASSRVDGSGRWQFQIRRRQHSQEVVTGYRRLLALRA